MALRQNTGGSENECVSQARTNGYSAVMYMYIYSATDWNIHIVGPVESGLALESKGPWFYPHSYNPVWNM